MHSLENKKQAGSPAENGRAHRKKHVLVHLFSVCLALGITPGLVAPCSGQTRKKKKVQPPVVRFDTPVDSTKKKTEKPNKKATAEKKDERLQLPDVLIYGTDSEKRIVGKKITISPDNTELISPSTIYDPTHNIDVKKGSRAKLGQQEYMDKSSMGELNIYGGLYQLYGAAAKWWHDMTTFEYGIDADFSHTDGQFTNSQHDEMGLGFMVGLQPSRESALKATGRYQRIDYGLHGARLPLYRRELDFAAMQVAGELNPTENMQLRLDSGFEKASAKDTGDEVSTLLHDVDNLFLTLGAAATVYFDNSELKLKATATSDKVDHALNDTSGTSWQQVRLGYSFPISGRLSSELAMNYTAVKNGDQKQQMLRPDASFLYVPHQNFVASLSYSGGMKYTTWKAMMNRNPYMNLISQATPEREKWAVTAHIDWRVASDFVFKMKYEQRHVENFNFFARDTNGTFALNHGEFRLGLTSIGGRIDFNETMNLEFSLNVLSDGYKAGNNFDNLIDIPYRGEFHMPFRFEYKPIDKVRLTTTLSWIGARRTQLLPEEGTNNFEELSSYLNGIFSANWTLSDNVEIYGSFNNMLDDNYEKWSGYQENGASGRAGFRASW